MQLTEMPAVRQAKENARGSFYYTRELSRKEAALQFHLNFQGRIKSNVGEQGEDGFSSPAVKIRPPDRRARYRRQGWLLHGMPAGAGRCGMKRCGAGRCRSSAAVAAPVLLRGCAGAPPLDGLQQVRQEQAFFPIVLLGG